MSDSDASKVGLPVFGALSSQSLLADVQKGDQNQCWGFLPESRQYFTQPQAQIALLMALSKCGILNRYNIALSQQIPSLISILEEAIACFLAGSCSLSTDFRGIVQNLQYHVLAITWPSQPFWLIVLAAPVMRGFSLHVFGGEENLRLETHVG
jgi:hypothetical protein